MEAQQFKVKVNGVQLACNQYGADGGKRIMLIHGWQGYKEMFRTVAQLLVQKGYTVVIPDLRGYGDSDKPEGDYTSTVFAADIYSLAQELGWLNGFILFGHSMGGYIALDYALRHPETLTHLIASNTSAYLKRSLLSHFMWWLVIRMYRKGKFHQNPEKTAKQLVQHAFKTPPSEDWIKEFIESYQKIPQRVGLSAISSCYQTNLEPQLPQITIPMLVIYSQHDQRDIRKASLQIHKLIGNSHLTVIPHAGHFPFAEMPDTLIDAILAFIS